MEELSISIEELEIEIFDIHHGMSNPFRYGRSPPNQEFIEIAGFGRKLLIAEAKLEFAKELLESIVSNNKTNQPK